MNIPLIDLKAQYENLKDKLDQATIDVLSNTRYIMGDNVRSFEEEFSDYLGVKHSISVGNGTDALVIALRALGIGDGDEVITSTYTFFATAESISAVGAIPVFVDVKEDTFNIDPSLIEEKITDRTRAIMPVHIFGQPVDMEEISKIAKKHELYLIEDACQAIGSEYKSKMAGNLSDIAAFSFFPTKNLGAAGDGGMIVTNNDDLATISRALRTHGSGENGQKAYNILNNKKEEVKEDSEDNTVYNPLKYYNYLIGYNSRLDEIQAALLRVKLRELDKWNSKREETAKYYNEQLKDTDLVTPFVDEDRTHVYHLYILQSENRSGLVEYLKENGISTGTYYPIPLHLQKAYKDLGYKKGDLPVAEYLSQRTFAIPVYPELRDEQKEYITATIRKFK